MKFLSAEPPVAAELAAAMKAVRHVLGRIAEDPQVAYRLGHCTASYELLCEAEAVYSHCTVEEVKNDFPPARQTAALPGVRAVLPDLQYQVCVALNIAPFLAAQIIAFAERRGSPLEAYHAHATDDEKLVHEADAARAYQAFCDARVPLHLHAA